MEGAFYPGSTLIIVLGSIGAFLGVVWIMLQTRIPGAENTEEVLKDLQYPEIDRDSLK